ncbi:uncharacterized protein TEOVI_000897000 [Trypanosoma equiperdum]|uniref:Uncharacterized protein n=4 Tax=Trypanozoon TaxID=39700 RepID=Q57WW5_TRYB2|nr:hypothetical protein, conserved [Trypanosoma brucei gambiense DAL972]XP_843678.1 hypothetical protein, conserved [Trypanosoma brucei brucei TREU927]6HIV_BW Chain BW, mL89 [Trypanosoma brucei brucei]6HIX_BW Chain BW, ml89 [Trypanosoma brucei brucei]6YXX_BW Chain BW, mL89 [Trypanosoma brucei brucei]6YXY_BW Chain BW, mL89 [Trypanosoma brucei brucei]AAX69902.1 hypothetical protein, conserved [Trypanosoma brucei]SCU65966.1 hypothetical protein, conserved [Trypanosoma equiperdum]AAZ10119.1 hyp|eukprot:XP_011771999.1 hypothetical protein, conserved [Trypanosoma brucei gambiense DAL972]
MSGAFGCGSYRSVVAGTQNVPRRMTFYPSAYELIQLHKAHREVIRHFYVRDKIFDNKFPGNALANGLFKFVPNRRENYHMRELMESIRRRSIWMHRIKQQREINAKVVENMEVKYGKKAAASMLCFTTPDSNAYFAPHRYQDVANSWPNYWQHPSVNHVVPKPRWRRHRELGGITRVEDPFAVQASDY